MNEWRPIETALKPSGESMGPPVLVYLETGVEPRVAVARYFHGWITVEDGIPVRPTHWMPLPAPPK